MSQQHGRASSRRRKKAKSQSPYPSAFPGKKKKKKGRRKQNFVDDHRKNETDNTVLKSNIDKNKNTPSEPKDNTDKKTHLNPTHILLILCGVSVIVIFCVSIVWIQYSKRLEMQFQLDKYNHEAEMTKIALERAKIDADIERFQQNLKEIQYNKELVETKQKHEMAMETMKLKHHREFETLKIEAERESETWTLKMQKMKSLLAETDKKLQFEQEHKGMVLKHETERIKLEYKNKLEESKTMDDNKRILNELKITKSSELYNNALDALNQQIGKEKEALELKRKECFGAKEDARDSWSMFTAKYTDHANDICQDYTVYRDDVNKLIQHLSALTQQKTKLIDDTNE